MKGKPPMSLLVSSSHLTIAMLLTRHQQNGISLAKQACIPAHVVQEMIRGKPVSLKDVLRLLTTFNEVAQTFYTVFDLDLPGM